MSNIDLIKWFDDNGNEGDKADDIVIGTIDALKKVKGKDLNDIRDKINEIINNPIDISGKQDKLTTSQLLVVNALAFTQVLKAKYDGYLATINGKQATLTATQLAVVNANPFTTAEKTKLDGIDLSKYYLKTETYTKTETEDYVAAEIDKTTANDAPKYYWDETTTEKDFYDNVFGKVVNVVHKSAKGYWDTEINTNATGQLFIGFQTPSSTVSNSVSSLNVSWGALIDKDSVGTVYDKYAVVPLAVATPISLDQATTKKYVDDAIAVAKGDM